MEHLDAIAGYLGVELTQNQIDLLHTYRDWLVAEAIPAGGLGPDEADRVNERHIGDSLVFFRFLGSRPEVWDLGSGVGLPGIPLAILSPNSSFSLIDRSGRRCDLMKRAVRVLGLGNVEVVQEEIDELVGPTDAIVSRGTHPPLRMLSTVRRLLKPHGVAVVAGSWKSPPAEEGWETIEVPAEVLDHTVWILMMRNE